MKFTAMAIPDIVLLEPQIFNDSRGWFMESFNQCRFHQGLEGLGLPVPPPFVQDNHSLSHKGVLRGLHYQLPPYAQGKLVRVTRGATLDVVVDIRKRSPTVGKWLSVELNARNQHMLWIPEGFAHGFLALEDNTEFSYKTTGYYAKGSERCIAWNDTSLAITWPDTVRIVVSEKDAKGILLAQAELFEQVSMK